ncbi:nitroreductase family protein [Sphingomicrobium lutaoense]|uniref:Putative NAD(P)H nitroreductase n=1 Tax=Sphingomicrobium lutaoense TaxID=515949 RepID=A0A839YT72_9SPHN|nr:nitroreductase [Sphingomicrobium lutaoense]MBB3763471.1 nitroreductase [Sphingomicrobium lutaoense]
MELNDRSSLLAHLETRRSGRPRDMVAPGPDAEQLAHILELAARTPDHGKLVPYRFVIVERDQRQALADLFARALFDEDPDAHDAKVAKTLDKAHHAPALIVLVSSPVRAHKIPVWEQELTCGAAGMNLLHAVHAHGFVGGWITGAQAYHPMVTRAFCEEGERIAGFFFIGSPCQPLEERDRPDPSELVTRWEPPRD